jgi:three-Cys-motif partner protein
MPTKREDDRYEIDPIDGLRREIVGDWVQEKHQRLRHYVDISRAARRKFAGNSTFIDLYCGPGRARIKDTTIVLPGSTVAAASEAARHAAFGKIYIGDLSKTNLADCQQRLSQEELGPAEAFHGTAESTAIAVSRELSRSGLHFAFLDPYSIQALPFSVIEGLAQLPRMDMLIHVSTMDLQRNVKMLMATGKLDKFAPGWRQHVNPAARNDVALLAVFHYWCDLIRSLGYQDVSDNVERVSGARNQPLYWLVLASKRELGKQFWGKISNVTPQQRLL